MANINEETAITNLQTYLRQLSYDNTDLTKVPIDGVYGTDTRQAVCEFQGQNGIAVTGIVDRQTWESIYDQYVIAVEKNTPPLTLNLFPRVPFDYAVKDGDEWFLVEVIQFLLLELTRDYDEFGDIEKSGIYDRVTQNAVADFQSRNGLPMTGNVDGKTWDALCREYDRNISDYRQ